ncbi:MAG: PGF-pre-PGF domain-containing protein [Dehalococcoidia bacterium]
MTWATLVGSPEPVDQILGKFARALSGVTISVENVPSKPSAIPALPDGQSAIEYFRVSMEGAEAEDLLAVHITFYVLKDVLETNNFHKWSILLNRFDEASGQWVAYDATRVREDDKKVFYIAVVPGFSLFAISGDVEPTSVRFQVSELTVSPAQAREGREITIQAIVRNVSAEERTFQANLWLNNTIGATQAVVLGAGESQTVTFTIAGEVGATEVRIDRLLDSFTVLAGILSDLNDDQVIDLRDAAILAAAFNTSQGQAGYLSIADLNGDGVIDVRDVAILAANIGRGG